MRTIVIVSLVLFGVGWSAAMLPVETSEPASASVGAEWRRTAAGWERATWTAPPEMPYQPAVHPLVVAGLELWLVVVACATHVWQTPGATRRS